MSERVTVKAEELQKVLNYLQTRPYNEAEPLIRGVMENYEPLVEKETKEKK